jgi:hypothetical protein
VDSIVSRVLLVLSGLFLTTFANSGQALAAPWVSQTSPANQSIGAARDTSIQIWFGSAMDPTTILAANVLVTSSLRGSVAGTVTWTAAQNRLLFDPTENFLAGERVGVTLTSGFEDSNGVPFAGGFHFEFSVWTKEMPEGVFLQTPQIWPTGSLATNLSIGDLNGDDRPEAVFSNSVPDSLTILSPNAIGGFTLYAQVPTGILPRHTLITDIDEDSDPDLLVCASGPSLLQVIKNNGAGNFAPPVSYPTGGTPYGAFAGDLDADGDLDVVTANFLGQSISVLMNVGGGLLDQNIDVSAGLGADSPRWVDGADFDGDGDIDLVCCNGYSDDISIFLNDGQGAMTVQWPRHLVGESPNFLEVRDYDGDTIVDIVTVDAQAGTLSFLRGKGDGTFEDAVASSVGGTLPYGIQVTDTDGDHDLDVIVPIRGLNGWRVMYNDGAGMFTQGTLYFGGDHCHTIGVADWNLDGDLDVIAGYAISKTMYFYGQVLAPTIVSTFPAPHATGASVAGPITISFNTNLDPGTIGPDTFQIDGTQSGSHATSVVWNALQKKITLTPTIPFLPGEIVAVTITDGLDAVEGIPFDGYSFEFMIESPNGTAQFSGNDVPLVIDDAVAMVAGDFDRDGSSDLAVAGFLSNSISVLFGTQGGGRQGSPNWDVDGGPIDLWCGDLDGDNQLDLVAATLTSASLSILHNSGNGAFVPGGTLSTSGSPFSVAGGDFDLDGDQDLVTGEVSPNMLRVFWNDGTGAFPAWTAIPTLAKPLDLHMADFDDDGSVDLAIADGESDMLRLYRNMNGGGFALYASPICGIGPVSIFSWDMNGDGRIDLATANYSSNTISILQSLGQFQFAAPVILSAGELPHSITGADLDGDARSDLVVANSGSANLSIYMNQGGTFSPQVHVPSGTTAFVAACGDWNSDGIVDIASLNRGEDSVSLLWNQAAVASPTFGLEIATAGLSAAPNPFRSKTEVQFQLAQPGPVLLHVFDVQGREITRLFEGQRGLGKHSLLWNGEDDQGRPVAAGVYFLQLDTADKSFNQKILRVR